MKLRLTRREFAAAMAVGTIGVPHLNLFASSDTRPAAEAVDHIILACPDLDVGIAYVAGRTGVHPVPSGSHPGRGTRNALASLGGRRYLEVLAIDPAQTVTNEMVTAVKALSTPTIIGWAMASTDLAALRTSATAAKLEPTEITPGARVTPSGKRLEWETVAFGQKENVLLPFAIKWKTPADHPSRTAPTGITLLDLWFESPAPAPLQSSLQALGISAQVRRGETPRIIVRVKGTTGDVEL
jgi:hypothetical protein